MAERAFPCFANGCCMRCNASLLSSGSFSFRPRSLLIILELPAIMLLAQGAQVVDLARVVEIVLDHHRDDPASLLQLAPVGQARAKQFGIIQGGDPLPQSLLALP